MHKASLVLAAGADFRLLGPEATMLESRSRSSPSCAVRTGAGKSQTSRRIGQILLDARPQASRSSATRCPTATSRRCACSGSPRSRTSTRPDPTIEEREEYERPVELGHGRLRRRRLRRDPRAGGGGGRRHRLGRRQQRLPVLPPGPVRRRRRPAARRARAPLPPGRDEPPHGRRRRRQQGRLGRRRSRSTGCSRDVELRQPDGAASSRARRP